MVKRLRSFITVRKIVFNVIVYSVFTFGINCTLEKYCNINDFKKISKIDIHCHVNTKNPIFLEQAVKDNFKVLTINTDAPLDKDIYEQQEIALYQMGAFPGQIGYLTTFPMDEWGSEGWLEKTIAYIEKSLERGALGVKVWKNIGMVEKDKDGSFIMIDDPRFDPLFNYLEENNISVCGHLGEPKNCWLSIDEMTVNNDKAYYKQHSQYHMFQHPEYPSYGEQIKARNHLLEKHPDLRFMGAHLGSLEWSVEELGRFLDRFPSTTVDMAARICHLQLQAKTDWCKVRDFVIRYQDRIIYGTDMGDFLGAGKEPEKLAANTHKTWMNDWKFLTTDETMAVDEINGEFKGIKLPRKVIEKIYCKNAEKMFPGI